MDPQGRGGRPRRLAAWDAAAPIAGVLVTAGFAPFSVWLLPVLGLALLFRALEDCTARRALLRGWLFGLGMFGSGIAWIHESFRFSQIAPPLAAALTALLVAGFALYPGLVGWLAVRLAASPTRGPAQGPALRGTLVALPAAWVLVEWLRGWLFTGFTWLSLGYSQVDSPLAGLAPLVGTLGIGWVVAASAGGLRSLAVPRGAGSIRGRCALAIVLLAAWLGSAGLRAVEWTHPAGPPVAVALVQGNVAQDLKWRAQSRDATVGRYLALTRAHWDAALVIWPETALPGLHHSFTEVLEALDTEARANRAQVLLGVPYQDPATRLFHNSVAVLGTGQGLYHKRHLVPFGEYLPLAWLLGGAVEIFRIPVSTFSPGPSAAPGLGLAGWPAGVSICYEVAFPGELFASLPEAAFLVNVSNDAWFGDSIGPHQHLDIARMRARESGRYLVRGTNTGITAVIGSHGEILHAAPQFTATVLRGEVVPMSGTTPYVAAGDGPVVMLAVIALVFGWRRNLRGAISSRPR